MPSWSGESLNILVNPPRHHCIFLAVLLDCRFRFVCLSFCSSPLISADDTFLETPAPWPTHQPPLLDRTISQPIAAGTIALEEAEEGTEYRAKVRTRNNLKAATGTRARAEAVVDVAEEGQEGHQAHTSPLSPPPNNRSRQKESLWLWYRKQKTATMSRPRSASSAPRQSSTRVSLHATTAPATFAP